MTQLGVVDGVRVSARHLSVVGAVGAAIRQVDVMTARQVVCLTSGKPGTSLDASRTGIEGLSLCAGC